MLKFFLCNLISLRVKESIQGIFFLPVERLFCKKNHTFTINLSYCQIQSSFNTEKKNIYKKMPF